LGFWHDSAKKIPYAIKNFAPKKFVNWRHCYSGIDSWLLNAYLPTYTITCLPTTFSPSHLITITAYLPTYRLYPTPHLNIYHSSTLSLSCSSTLSPTCPPTPSLPLTYLPTHPCTYLTPWKSPWQYVNLLVYLLAYSPVAVYCEGPTSLI